MDLDKIAERTNLIDRLSSSASEKQRLRKLLAVSMLDEDRGLLEDIDTLLSLKIPKAISSKVQMLEFPSPEESVGDIDLGNVLHGDSALHEFSLTLPEIQNHVFITGRSGAGKTVLLKRMARQLARKVPTWIITHKGKDFRDLAAEHPELIVIPSNMLRLNLLKPVEDMSFDVYKGRFVLHFGHVYGIWHGSTQLLLEGLDQAHREKGDKVTLADVYEILNSSTESLRKRQDYWVVTVSRLYGLLSKCANAVASRNSLNLKELASRNVIFELDGFDFEDASLIQLNLSDWLFNFCKKQGESGSLRNCLVVDEAKHSWPASDRYSSTVKEYSKISPMDLIFDESRSWGLGIVAADNEPNQVSPSVIGQSYTKISGSLGSGLDIGIMSEAMNLSDEERDILSHLEVGHFLLKLAGRYTKPFLLRVPNLTVAEALDDDAVRQRLLQLFPDLSLEVLVVRRSDRAYAVLE